MYHTASYRLSLIAVGALLAVLGWPNLGAAQTVSGQARAVQASVTGIFGTTTTMLADTGTFAFSAPAFCAAAVTRVKAQKQTSAHR